MPATRRPPAPHAAPPADAPPFHAEPAERALAHVDVDRTRGLTAAEAARRLAEGGPNVLGATRGESWLALLWRQLKSPLVLVLLAAGALAIALGKGADGAVVLGVVALNTLIGFVQEWRAGQAIRALSQLVTERARTRRDGLVTSVLASELVAGDVVLLEAGEQVPADLRLLAARGLETTEAALTGESLPVHKDPAPVAADASLGDRRSMAYAGTLVTAGAGEGVVVATATRTELGRIQSLLETAAPGETPLVRALAVVARTLTIAICAVAVLLAGVALWRGYAAGDAVLAAITLAVAAIPEGLPAIVTIALAIGVRRMARRRAVVRNLPAVETLGGVTIICSDKTGTLTRNEMTVQALWSPAAGAWAVDGVGYAPAGAIRPADDAVGAPSDAPSDGRPNDGAPPAELPDAVRALLVAGALCSDARLVRGAPVGDAARGDDARGGDARGVDARDDGAPEGAPRDDGAGDAWRVEGDPTEGALVVVAAKAGLAADALRAERPRLDAVPFDSARQWMATLHPSAPDAPAGDATLYAKGAPEVLLPHCATDAAGAPLDRAAAADHAAALARRGLRVLAVAARRTDAGSLDAPDGTAAPLPRDLVLLGLVGMIDPPRPEAITAVAACRAAGIDVAMITGDHRETAVAVGRALGLVPEGRADHLAAVGAELAAADDAALRTLARERRVFARVSPEQKLRLVRALQADGHVVAMTGDGVNDAPALKQADIGVAMGITGTAVSREAADVVLTDDDFATIAAAVTEGRRVYDNLVKALAFVLPTNLGEALIILVAVVAFPVVGGTPLLPMAPVQILWINLVATVTLALPLAFEAREPDVMRRPPRPADAPLLDGFVQWRTVSVALLMTAVAIVLFLLEHARLGAAGVPAERALREAQTLAVTAVVLMQMAYVIQCRSRTGSVREVGLWSNRWVWVGIAALGALQAAFVHWGPLQHAFAAAPLEPAAWGRAALGALTVVPLVAAEKRWRRGREARARTGRGGAPRRGA